MTPLYSICQKCAEFCNALTYHCVSLMMPRFSNHLNTRAAVKRVQYLTSRFQHLDFPCPLLLTGAVQFSLAHAQTHKSHSHHPSAPTPTIPTHPHPAIAASLLPAGKTYILQRLLAHHGHPGPRLLPAGKLPGCGWVWLGGGQPQGGGQLLGGTGWGSTAGCGRVWLSCRVWQGVAQL